MQLIRHNGVGDGAIGGGKLRAEIQESNTLAVIEFSHVGVDGSNFIHAHLPRVRHATSHRSGATREDREQENLGVGQFVLDHADDLAVGLGDILGGVVHGIVGTDHEYGDFRGNLIELAFFYAKSRAEFYRLRYRNWLACTCPRPFPKSRETCPSLG